MFLSFYFLLFFSYYILSKIDVSFIFIMELSAIVEIVKLYVFTDTCVIIYCNALLSTKCSTNHSIRQAEILLIVIEEFYKIVSSCERQILYMFSFLITIVCLDVIDKKFSFLLCGKICVVIDIIFGFNNA